MIVRVKDVDHLNVWYNCHRNRLFQVIIIDDRLYEKLYKVVSGPYKGYGIRIEDCIIEESYDIE